MINRGLSSWSSCGTFLYCTRNITVMDRIRRLACRTQTNLKSTIKLSPHQYRHYHSVHVSRLITGGHHILLQWIPRQAGIPGNFTDLNTSSAHESPDIISLPISRTDAPRLVHRAGLELSSSHGDNSARRTTSTMTLIPNLCYGFFETFLGN